MSEIPFDVQKQLAVWHLEGNKTPLNVDLASVGQSPTLASIKYLAVKKVLHEKGYLDKEGNVLHPFAIEFFLRDPAKKHITLLYDAMMFPIQLRSDVSEMGFDVLLTKLPSYVEFIVNITGNQPREWSIDE